MIMASEHDSRSVRTTTVVQSIHLAHACHSLCQNCVWDLDSEVIVILLGFLTGTEHECTAVRYHSVDNLKQRIKCLEDQILV